MTWWRAALLILTCSTVVSVYCISTGPARADEAVRTINLPNGNDPELEMCSQLIPVQRLDFPALVITVKHRRVRR